MSKMTVDLKVGETLTIGEATVRLEQKSGQLARLVIVADDATPITPPKARRNTASEARMSALHIETGAHTWPIPYSTLPANDFLKHKSTG